MKVALFFALGRGGQIALVYSSTLKLGKTLLDRALHPKPTTVLQIVSQPRSMTTDLIVNNRSMSLTCYKLCSEFRLTISAFHNNSLRFMYYPAMTH